MLIPTKRKSPAKTYTNSKNELTSYFAIFALCKPPYRVPCKRDEESPGNIGHRTVRKCGLSRANAGLTDSATENR